MSKSAGSVVRSSQSQRAIRLASAWLGAARGRFAPVLALLATLAATTGALVESPAARAAASGWVEGPKSQARLISAGGLAISVDLLRAQGLSGSAYLAAVEIHLAPNNLTYWRLPGDAGVPPAFSFEGSLNLARAEVRYPAPHQFDEAGGQAYGYRDSVVFPLVVTPADPGQPVSLKVKLAYATCDKICIPAEFEASLGLDPGEPASQEALTLGTWLARTPRPAGVAGAPQIAVTPGGDGRSWQVSVAPATAAGELFAEGPEGWFFDTMRTAQGFEVRLAEKPADPRAGAAVPILLTLVTGEQAFETRTNLDVSRSTP